MDGLGYAEAANDDGSGDALVMELARIFCAPDVQTERSIRFVLWNNEETGLNGARAYVDQRQELQGKEDPPGSGEIPRAQVARHDPARHDAVRPRHAARGRHAAARAAPRGRRQHRIRGHLEDGGRVPGAGLALPGGQRPVRDRLSRHRRQPHDQHRLGAVPGFLPGHQPARKGARLAGRHRLGSARGTSPRTCSATFSDKDFRLGLNAAQTTLAAVAQLAGAKIK